MALTEFQRATCRLLSSNRIENNASFLAGGAALNSLLEAPRLSRDLDLFHDSAEAVRATWDNDQRVLEGNGYVLDIVREREGFVEIIARRGEDSVEIQWVQDSAFRFFPPVPHPDLGLVLHPFDLATNKVLALVGREKARDWVDTLTCHERLSPLGLLTWAACGKDEGLNPQFILDEAARTARYSREEILELDWGGQLPDFGALKMQWRAALSDARTQIEILPPETLGQAVLNEAGAPWNGAPDELQLALDKGELRFHVGHIGGAWPDIKG